MSNQQPEIQAFLSYAHADDAEFGIVEPFKAKLEFFVKAKGGRALEMFVDRESIGWGADWRQSISDSVEAATVFVPLLSANYLESSHCREEFLAFHTKATSLGVTELLLPILLFRSPLFEVGTTDEVAQIAERLQYKCVEDALLSGYTSPEWLRCTNELAESLLGALDLAESSLLASEATSVHRSAGPEFGGMSPITPTTEEFTGEEDGLAELMERMEAAAEQMTEAAQNLSAAIEQLGSVAERTGVLPDDARPKRVGAWALDLAFRFRSPAVEIETGGRDLFEATKELDEVLASLGRLADSAEWPELRDQIDLGNTVAAFGDLREVSESMEALLVSMRPAEVLSVPLRKSLEPARRGIIAVKDSVHLIESWQSQFEGDVRSSAPEA